MHNINVSFEIAMQLISLHMYIMNVFMFVSHAECYKTKDGLTLCNNINETMIQRPTALQGQNPVYGG